MGYVDRRHLSVVLVLGLAPLPLAALVAGVAGVLGLGGSSLSLAGPVAGVAAVPGLLQVLLPLVALAVVVAGV